VKKHLASRRFWRHYRLLPEEVRKLADKNFALLKADPHHPSLHLKKIESIWSVRVGAHYRRWAWTVRIQSCGSGLGHMLNMIGLFSRGHRTSA